MGVAAYLADLHGSGEKLVTAVQASSAVEETEATLGPGRNDGRRWTRQVALEMRSACSNIILTQIKSQHQSLRIQRTTGPFCSSLGTKSR